MASESIAHSAFGLMGYRLRTHSGSRNKYVPWHTEKNWALGDLVAAISAALHEAFVRGKYANSVSQFLL